MNSAIINDEKTSLHYCAGIYAFDININIWNKIFVYPKELTTSGHSAVFNQDKNCIYVLDEMGKLFQFDLTVNKMTVLHERVKDHISYAGLVLVGNDLHIFGWDTHTICDAEEQTFNYQYIPHEYFGFDRCTVAYLKSRNIILMFSRGVYEQ